MSAHRKWTEAEDLALMEMSRGGYGPSRIAPLLGRSKPAVQHRGLYLRQSPWPWPEHRQVHSQYVAQPKPLEPCEAHLQAILKDNPAGFLSFSEHRSGPGKVAVCPPLYHPLRRAA